MHPSRVHSQSSVDMPRIKEKQKPIEKPQSKKVTIMTYKKEINTFVFPNDMIVFIENPKESTDQLLELINELSMSLNTKPI